jgi:hypothetical protein
MNIIDNHVTEEEANEEEDFLDLCRRKRCYNGPAGGPPGLTYDEPHDPAKAVRFRRLCEYFQTKYPELVFERPRTKLIDDDLIYSLAKDYLDMQEFVETGGSFADNNTIYNHLIQIRIEGVAKGLSEIEIRDIVRNEKQKLGWLQ